MSVCAGRTVGGGPGGSAVEEGKASVESREMWGGRGKEYFVQI